jgi:hypothetical protein
MALGSTKSLTKMITEIILGVKGDRGIRLTVSTLSVSQFLEDA